MMSICLHAVNEIVFFVLFFVFSLHNVLIEPTEHVVHEIILPEVKQMVDYFTDVQLDVYFILLFEWVFEVEAF